MFKRNKYKQFISTRRKLTSVRYKPTSSLNTDSLIKALVIALSIVAVIIMLGGFVYGIAKGRQDKTLVSGYHIVILLDLTDGMSKNQENIFTEEIGFVESNLKSGDKLSIYMLTEKRKQLFSCIRPDDGVSASEFTSNPTMIKRNFIKTFKNPLHESLNGIRFQQRSNSSRILEIIRFIGRLEGFKKSNNKKLVIFSNMLQNSTSLSHYGGYDNIDEIQSYVVDVKNLLVNTDVCIFMLQGNKRLQNGRILGWWKEYFKLTGVKSIEFKTL